MSESHDLARVIDNFLPAFNQKHKLPGYKLKTLGALQHCRTPYMGGHVEACECCGEIRVVNNSCRNRHCPRCGGIDKEKWIISREKDLLPVKYFHVVFTVPDKLDRLFINNQAAMYNLLFSVAWDVLKDFGSPRRWIGGKMGAISILHTWGQNLWYHPHLHFIVPAGAIMPAGKWKHSRSRGKFLFKVDMLSNVFRARFVKLVREMIREKQVTGHLPGGLFDNNWVVYAKQPFGGPGQVINYLGRYTHRTAISNDRIQEVTSEKVTFTWKDYHDNYLQKTTTLDGEDFLNLFCQHILPPGFTRIRHFGFLSNALKARSLALIRLALKVKPLTEKDDRPIALIALERMGIKPGTCKSCGGKMVLIEIPRNHFHPGKRAPPLQNDDQLLNDCKTRW